VSGKSNISISIALAVAFCSAALARVSTRDVPQAQDKQTERPRVISPSDQNADRERQAETSCRANESCWHPGLARNIGIAELSCDVK
jgi:hypothetical protein